MASRYVVRGQTVRQSKKDLARQMRKRMTPAETVLWRELRDHRLGGMHFRRQQVIGGYVADFYCHSAGLVIEVDGKHHEHQAAYDVERDKAIATFDLTVIRFANNEVMTDLSSVLDRISSYLDAKGASNDDHQ